MTRATTASRIARSRAALSSSASCLALYSAIASSRTSSATLRKASFTTSATALDQRRWSARFQFGYTTAQQPRQSESPRSRPNSSGVSPYRPTISRRARPRHGGPLRRTFPPPLWPISSLATRYLTAQLAPRVVRSVRRRLNRAAHWSVGTARPSRDVTECEHGGSHAHRGTAFPRQERRSACLNVTRRRQF